MNIKIQTIEERLAEHEAAIQELEAKQDKLTANEAAQAFSGWASPEQVDNSRYFGTSLIEEMMKA